jgi:hypothetical protein
MHSLIRRRVAWLGYSAALALTLWSAPVKAVHDESFQVDGDANEATCGAAFGGSSCATGSDDWDSIFSCAAGGGLGCTKATPGSGNSADAISDFVVDPAPLSIFTGGGSKDEKDLTAWRWKNGSVPDKDDLIEAHAALYDGVIYFGANRLAVNGDAQIGFWFFQTDVSLKADGTFQDADGNPAKHQVNDLLVLSNFVQGGGSANIQVYQVVQTTPGPCLAGSVEASAGAGDICLKLVEQGSAGLNGVCNNASGDIDQDSACAATNGAVVPALDPDFEPKSGANTGQYPIVGFFEGGVNLAELGLGSVCFPVFAAETRSSQSITAVLKDFTLGKFENCNATARTEIHQLANNSDADIQGSSVEPGTAVHDLVIVTGTPGASSQPTGTVTFELFANATCAGTASSSETVAIAAGIAGCPTGSKCANSTASTLNSPGAISYLATYNGDNVYDPVEALCEPLRINKFKSATATHIFTVTSPTPNGCLLAPCEITDNFVDLAGASTVNVRDQVVITRDTPVAGDPTPTGTVTFTRYQFSNCTGSTSSETLTLGGNGACPVAFPAAPSGGAAGCSSVFGLGPSSLGYRVTYSGDDNYLPATQSRCEPACAIDSTK